MPLYYDLTPATTVASIAESEVRHRIIVSNVVSPYNPVGVAVFAALWGTFHDPVPDAVVGLLAERDAHRLIVNNPPAPIVRSRSRLRWLAPDIETKGQTVHSRVQ